MLGGGGGIRKGPRRYRTTDDDGRSFKLNFLDRSSHGNDGWRLACVRQPRMKSHFSGSFRSQSKYPDGIKLVSISKIQTLVSFLELHFRVDGTWRYLFTFHLPTGSASSINWLVED